ncbi:hypothetical protein ORJ04_10020 [Rheinheimera baltica]|uniref:Haemolysin-type calcium binding-related domain-containing protein n=1 Tax=Rheinheimera baltica TaxID=67576 RepID=A0ABT9HYT9_9GAMM|nr:hypothetical protein [Rheinheimera baltica]
MSLQDSTDHILVTNYFQNDGISAYQLEEIRFADGTIWNTEYVKLQVLQSSDLNDTLTGYASADELRGQAGNDSLYGQDGDDALYGGADNDYIYGGNGNDLLRGDDGQDRLNGGAGDDVLDGGAGDDLLTGGAGNDTYLFGRGDGWDNIYNAGNTDDANPNRYDRLLFKEGVAVEDIEYYRSGDSLTLRIIGSNDSVSISGWFNKQNPGKLNAILFADGRNLNLAQIELDVQTVRGNAEDNYLSGFDTDDSLYGYAGDDKLQGHSGDDMLDGGTGNDELSGGEGSDVYHFERGWGSDVINNYETSSDSIDVIEFGAGINSADIEVSRLSNDLILTLKNTNDNITVRNYFLHDTYSTYAIEDIRFADGTVWNIAMVKAMQLTGTAGDDAIIGYDTDDTFIVGPGNDYVAGSLGNDTYQIAANHGDIVIEEGQFDLAPYQQPGWRIDGRDNINDVLNGTAGYDHLRGLSGNDTLTGGNGNDLLDGGAGSDIYRFDRSWGNDHIDNYDASSNKTDAIEFAAGINPGDIKAKQIGDDLLLIRAGSPDTIRVTNYFLDNAQSSSKLEEVRFADGTVWSIADIKQAVAGYDASTDGSLDRIVFADMTSADIIVRRATNSANTKFVGKDLQIINSLTGAVITVKDYFVNHKAIEQFEFSDGTVWNTADILAKALEGSVGDDILNGSDEDDVIHGDAGADRLIGFHGNDELHGGDGDDFINGGTGDDVLYGGEGNDRIIGGYSYAGGYASGDDIVYGGAGDDVIIDSDDNNQLFGEDGNDTITGTGLLDGGAGDDVLEGKGADILRGGDGNDTLTAHSDSSIQNSNILQGGKGNDTMYGGFGDDTYVFNLGDGADVIIERRQGEAYSNVDASNDTLQFGEGIAADDLMFVRSGSDLLIRHSNGSDSVTVQNWFAGSAHYKLNLLTFADGSELTAEQIESQLVTLGTAGNDSLFGSAQADTVYGEAGDDYIDGRAGDDTLHGGDGNDTLIGGTGNDLLLGGVGDDQYVYNPQNGRDTIDNTGGGFDGIFFNNGIDSSRLSFSQDGDDLVILVDGDEAQSVRVLNHFLGGDAELSFVQPSGGNMITAEQIAAAIAGGGDEEPVDPTDPTDPVDPGQGGDITPGLGGDDTLTGTTGHDVLIGGAGDDELTGLAGNDRLFGGAGDDSYIYHSGQDVITELAGTDKLIFSNGISFNDVASGLTKSGNDLVLKVNGSAENSVTLTNFFLGGANLVESFEFETGGSISAAQIFGAFGLAMPSGEAPAVNTVHGSAGDDTLNGGAAADVLAGSHGNDTLNGSTGNDTLIGGRGNDTYVFSAGSGHDIIDNTGGGEDVLLFEGISFNQVASGLMKSGNDLVLNIGGGSDKVTLKNWFLGGDYVVPTIRFAAGGEITANQIFGAFGLSNPNPQGSLGYTDLPDERGFGNVFVGTGAAESIIGSSDDDFIDGGDGNDTLRGGAGNDYLSGGRGNDTYLFGSGTGDSIINNYDPSAGRTDVLRFDDGIMPTDVVAQRDGDNLMLSMAQSSVTVLNYFAENGESSYRLDHIEFADGTVWDSSIVAAQLATAEASNALTNANAVSAFAAMATVSDAAIPNGLEGVSSLGRPGNDLPVYDDAPEVDSGITLVQEDVLVRKAGNADVIPDMPRTGADKWLLDRIWIDKPTPELPVAASSSNDGQEISSAPLVASIEKAINELNGLEVMPGIDLPVYDDAPEVDPGITLVQENVLVRKAGNADVMPDMPRTGADKWLLDRIWIDDLRPNLPVAEFDDSNRDASDKIAPHYAVVDTRYASLVDALNSFDSDDAEIGGNLALPPKLEEYYY